MMQTATAQVELPSESEVLVTRSFRAPRALVFKAWTTPELMRQWLGYPGWTMPVCEMDVRVGGKYRWWWRSEDGDQEFGFFGEFLEVDAPSRLRHTESFDPGTIGGSMGDVPAMVTLTMTEADGITTVETLIDYGSQESRDAALATGMTDGMEVSYKRLEALLATAPAP